MSLVSSKLSGYGHRLISVGRLEKRKGFDTVVRLLPELLNRYPDLVYIVIGEGSQKHTLEDIANILGVGDNVMILGYQDTESRNAWIKNSDIFVLPARQENDDVEGFGIAFIEAGWFGLPSVAGDTGGAKEAVIQNETGLVCPGDEPESVLRCLRQLIDDSELRSRLGQRARQRAASLLWNHVIEHYIDLIERKD